MRRPLSSMTGFGRASGQLDNHNITCEIKSVNGRGLDIRTRLSPGFDNLDTEIRRLLGEKLARGSVTVFLNVQRQAGSERPVVNEVVLETILAAIEKLSARLDASKPSIESILALKGVLDTEEPQAGPEDEQRLNLAVLDCVAIAANALIETRHAEGERIAATLGDRVDEIESLALAAQAHPARSRNAILERLRQQISTLLGAENGLSEDRLHQEALVLATKADITEELDRISAHVKAARELLSKGGPIGRKLDFLSQEFNREANTLCSKSNDVGLTAIGLDLKAAIDQLREQVQNLE